MKPSLVFCIVLFLLFTGCTLQKEVAVYDLTCENLENPLGIATGTPRFGWKIRSRLNGTEQTAYQVMVAGDPALLHKNKADLWDSGKISSSESIWVPFAGKALAPGTPAWWKVRVWDAAGNVSDWSPLAQFSIGLLNEEDWQAEYIGFPTDAGYRECPQFRQSFQAYQKGEKLLLHVNSLGYHEVYLNGEKVGEGVLSPAVSQFDKRSHTITYDVSPFVKKGQNELLLWLGSGWYTEGLPGVAHNGPLVKAQLERFSKGIREIVLFTGSNWLGRKSAYTRQGNWRPHQFGGEILDGTMAKSDLNPENQPERSWSPVSVVTVPAHQVSPQMVELNKITEVLKPVEISQAGKDTFLVDMGKCLTGWTEVRFPKLQKSQEIVLEYADHLDKNGNLAKQRQTDRYIASGEESEIFKNKFNYHAYRYLRISNLTEAPSPENITAYLIHTGYRQASGFSCSDPDLNQIHDMLFYTLCCLSLGGDLVDCPHIERLGYGGDGNASTVTAQTMFNLGPLYTNWLQAWADCVRDDGGMPHTAPNPYPAGGGPYWCGFIITASWQTFLNYGDTLLLKKHYPVMQKWLGYVDQHTVDGLLKRWPDTDYRGWYLGDWATPTGIDQTAEASVNVVNNSFVAVCLDNMQKIARVLGKPEDEKMYAAQKEQLQRKIHETCFDGSNFTYGTGTQIDLAFPMIAGVVPEDQQEEVKKSLFHETEINRNGHFACGLVGLPVITEWAVKNQAAGWMYSMLKKRGYPGYLYMIDNGATTTWEHWNGDRSRIHNCYNGIGSWFYQAVGGICPAEDVPAWRKVRIQPQIPEGVTWAKTYKETPFGKLSVNWNLVENRLEMELEIPVGTEAEIVLPEGEKKYTLDGAEKELQQEANGVILKSGTYKISYKI
ncbi:family 78 glycoside hydrolase catalytic domain [Gaoshiqia sp. Z1-71]|uniref:family 78 glycoside hydrolase catalytic domain n=1 Tax=Gaoshiqia hydrogeniformans TaxID=3290090 RepID=UPI003BF9206C